MGLGHPILDNVRIELSSTYGAFGIYLLTGLAELNNVIIDVSGSQEGTGITNGAGSSAAPDCEDGKMTITNSRVKGNTRSLYNTYFVSSTRTVPQNLVAAGTQFHGPIVTFGSVSVLKLVHCYDGDANPIPNQ